MHRLGFRVSVLIPAILVVAVSACGSDDKQSATPSPSVVSGVASLLLLKPDKGSHIPAGDVTVVLQVDNFKLVEKFGRPAVAGEGHIHYYLDVPEGAVSDDPDTPAVPPKDVGTYVTAAGTSYTWKDVKPGPHIFAALLVDNDHTPIGGDFFQSAAQVRVTVE